MLNGSLKFDEVRTLNKQLTSTPHKDTIEMNSSEQTANVKGDRTVAHDLSSTMFGALGYSKPTII